MSVLEQINLLYYVSRQGFARQMIYPLQKLQFCFADSRNIGLNLARYFLYNPRHIIVRREHFTFGLVTTSCFFFRCRYSLSIALQTGKQVFLRDDEGHCN